MGFEDNPADDVPANKEEYEAWQRQQDAAHDDCDGCAFWSELCAQSIGCGPMEAMCLNPQSPHYQRMVNRGCAKYHAGRSIDDPSR